MMSPVDRPSQTQRIISLAAICVVIAGLHFAQDVLIPLALAVLLSFLLAPLVMRLQRWHLPRTLSVILVVGAMMAIVGVIGWAITLQVQDLAQQLPDYKDNIVAKIRAVRTKGHNVAMSQAAQALQEVKQAVAAPPTQPAISSTTTASRISDDLNSARNGQPLPVRIVSQPSSAMDTLWNYLGTALNPVATAVIVIVFVIFMLIQREDLRDRVIRLMGEGQLGITTQAIDDAATRITRYLMAQGLINGGYAAFIILGLLLIGRFLGYGWFPSFILWGVLCGILRFMPYIGIWIGAFFPITLAFAVYPGYAVFFAVLGLFALAEVLAYNFVEPWLYGSQTGISTIAILVAAVFWTWLWGPVGLLLSTPLTVCIVVAGKYVPQFAVLDILLSDRPVLKPHQRLYQRLLAEDAHEATELAQEALRHQSLEQVYDTMIIPTLAMAEKDRHADKLDDTRDLFIRQTLRDLVSKLVDQERAKAQPHTPDQAPSTSSKPPADQSAGPGTMAQAAVSAINIACMPAHDEADEIVAIMLSQLLELRGYNAWPLSEDALAGEMLDQVRRRKAQLVCISALPPAAVIHSRYLYKRLQNQRQPKLGILVGLWTMTAAIPKAQRQVAGNVDIAIATTLSEALEKVRQLAQPFMLEQNPHQPLEIPSLNPSSPPRRP